MRSSTIVTFVLQTRALMLLLLAACGPPEFIVTLKEWPKDTAQIRIRASREGHQDKEVFLNDNQELRFVLELPTDDPHTVSIDFLGLDSPDAATACKTAHAELPDVPIPDGLRRYVEYPVPFPPSATTCTLKVKIEQGDGHIAADPGGIDCSAQGSGSCEHDFVKNTPVTLMATRDDKLHPELMWTVSAAPLAGCPLGDTCQLKLTQRTEVEPRPCPGASDGWCAYPLDPSTPKNFVFMAIWGSTANDIWAVGYDGDLASPPHTGGPPQDGIIYHWDGKSWSINHRPHMHDPMATDRYRDIWGSGPDDVWVAGDFGILLHYTGGTWQQEKTSESTWRYGIWGSKTDDSIWTVGYDSVHKGQDGVIHRKKGSTESRMHTSTNYLLNAIWGTDPTDIWACGDNGAASGILLNWDPVSETWKPPPGTPPFRKLISIWGSAKNDYWAVGDSGTLLRYDGTSWSVTQGTVTKEHLFAIWGLGSKDVWIGGTNGAVLHWDGSTWTPSKPVTPNRINDFWGASSNDVWAVGAGGTILHYQR